MLKRVRVPHGSRNPENDRCHLPRSQSSRSRGDARVSCPKARVARGKDDSFREVRCHSCQCIFYLCRRDDRGQRYCSAPCRKAGRQQSAREARRRHQQSEDGRADHARRQREYRRKKTVMDQGTQKLAPVSKVCMEADDHSTALVVEEVVGRKSTHDETERTDDGHPTRSNRDQITDDERARSGDESDTAASVTRSSPSSLDAGRSAGAVVPAATIRCAVCGRVGRTVRDGFLRRVRVRGGPSPLRRGSGESSSKGGRAATIIHELFF